MKRVQSFFQIIPRFLSLCAGVVLIAILGIQVLGQHAFQSMYQNRSLLSNLVLYPVALAGIAVLFSLCNRPFTVFSKTWQISLLFLCTLAVQFLVARTCWYHLGWDPGTVHAAAEEIARGLPITDRDYFISCPNNAPLTVLLSVPLWIAIKAGLAVPYVVLPYLDAVVLNGTALLCVLCVQRLTENGMARLLSLTISIGWIALSPYIIFPYTDVYAIFFPVAAFYLYLTMRRPVLRWFFISLLCFLGAAIKPTVLIFLIALLILSLCQLVSRRREAGLMLFKRTALVGVAILLGALPGKSFQVISTDWITAGHSADTHLSMTHYLMLGMNGETYGGHSVDDVAFTMEFDTLAESQSANLRRAWERLSGRSVMENVRFFAVKAYKAYADGSFASHGSFLEVDIPHRGDAISRFLRSLYHKDGRLMPYCQTLVQCMWLGVLTLCATAAVRRRRHPTVALLCLTLLGLTAYLLLFEVWPRYLFLYAPFFVILASMAFDKPSAPVL